MKELMAYIRESAAAGAFIGLMSAKGLEDYYQSFGFMPRPTGAPGMYQVVPPESE